MARKTCWINVGKRKKNSRSAHAMNRQTNQKYV